MAIACCPKLLIADEPTTALDVTIQAQILDIIKRLRRELGMAVMFITHDMGVIAEVSDRVMVMYAGSIVEEAPVKKFFACPLHPYTRALLSAIPLPDPAAEKRKVLEVYDPSCHHYEADPPTWTEIEPGHFVLANQEELEKYRTMI